jgi:hypothetical protein
LGIFYIEIDNKNRNWSHRHFNKNLKHWLWDPLVGRNQKGVDETVNKVRKTVIKLLLDAGQKANLLFMSWWKVWQQGQWW